MRPNGFRRVGLLEGVGFKVQEMDRQPPDAARHRRSFPDAASGDCLLAHHVGEEARLPSLSISR